jgi:hypothetical protein
MTEQEREDQLWRRAVNTHVEDYLDFPQMDPGPFRTPCREKSAIDVARGLVTLRDEDGRELAAWAEGDWPDDVP